MVNFISVVGPKFDPSYQDFATFRTLAIILSFSRFVLACQYLVVLLQIRNYQKSKVRMGLMVTIYFVASATYFCTFLAFKKGEVHGSIYIAWYVTVFLETVFNVTVTSLFKILSFKGTHLVQRMTLLTLIILGEGIIVVCKSITAIVKNEGSNIAWTPSTVGNVVSAVSIIVISPENFLGKVLMNNSTFST